MVEERFDALDAPVMRVTYPDTHCPFSQVLEHYNLPNADKIGRLTDARFVLGPPKASTTEPMRFLGATGSASTSRLCPASAGPQFVL